jgi:flagellar basal-body rod modification protein FlgD
MSVMNVKRGTTSFSKGEGNSAMKAEAPVHSASAPDMQAAYGDQNVGDVLNKIADPNWVDPSKKVRTSGDPSMGKDAFMKLMLTQMKFQDPTSPMQSHEMAAQLAQFSSLEQLSNIHGTLESMKTQSQPSTNYQALALIGKKVAGDSSKLTRGTGDTKHGVGFELLQDAARVVVTVKDALGAPVRKMEFSAMKKGDTNVEWNGLKEDGTAARPGEYKISVEAVNASGKKVFAKTTFGGKITGLNFTADGPVLMVGNKTVKLSDVKKIEDSADGPDAVPAGMKAIPLKAGEAAAAGSPAGAPAGSMPGMMALPQNSEQAGKAALAAAMAPQFMKLAPPPPAPETVVKPEAKSPPAVKNHAPPAMIKQAEAGHTVATQAKPGQTAIAQSQTAAAGSSSVESEENIPPAEDDPNPGNIGTIPMSPDLMAQLEKQTKN